MTLDIELCKTVFLFIQGSQTDILFNIIINSKRSYHSYPHVRIILKTGIIVQIEKMVMLALYPKEQRELIFLP